MYLKPIVDIIQRHSTASMVRVSARAVMFAYGAADEIKDMIRDVEEEFSIHFSDSDYDVCEIGEWTVMKFIDYVEQRIALAERNRIEFVSKNEDVVGTEQASEYSLSFAEAMKLCLVNGKFVRGENFKSGVYARSEKEVVILVDGWDLHKPIGNMLISEGAFKQKYKAFSVASHKELRGLEEDLGK